MKNARCNGDLLAGNLVMLSSWKVTSVFEGSDECWMLGVGTYNKRRRRGCVRLLCSHGEVNSHPSPNTP